jgi:putative heme-binding domain-containing protein
MQAGKPVFDGNPSRLAYALKEVGDPRAIAPLVEVIQQGGIAEADLPQAVSTVAALGQAPELDAMLAMAQEFPALLSAIAAGAKTNSEVPTQAQAVTTFLGSKQGATRIAAAHLCGIWKVSAAREKLIALAGAPNLNAQEAVSLCQALAAIGRTSDLEELSAPGHSSTLRAAAISAWARQDPASAAKRAASLLLSLDASGSADAKVVFSAFIGRREGAEALTRALSKGRLDRALAIAGVALAHASGRDLGTLVSTLNAAGGLEPLSQDLSQQERGRLLAEAQKSGNVDRGRDVYHRKTLLCSSCHLIENRGGRLGPDLSTVGSYMTPEAILESLIHPSSSIKQGYETVLVTTRDKALVIGLLQRKTGDSVLLRDPSGNITAIPNRDIAKIDVSPVSLMPPALTATLRRDEMVDLLCFLTSLGKKRP